MRSVKKLVRKSLQVVTFPIRVIHNIWFAYCHRHLRHQQKIIYTLTPPPRLKNVGDHAQAVAICIWLKKHFPEYPLLEVDKDQTKYFLFAMRWLVQAEDIIFLHSGGNLGDRGIWSERIRRLVILSFPKNRIVSLPQTIYFSNTTTGRREQAKTRRIYASHSNLTVIGRDPRSGDLAAELFPDARTFCMPDFVLSLPTVERISNNGERKVLLCLRLDDESALTSSQRKEISGLLPYECTYYDTTLKQRIPVAARESILKETLDLFSSSDAIVTDRYHGLIFAVLCKKPCVVLRTVDHKLTSAIHWFKDITFVRFAEDLDDIPKLLENCLLVNERNSPDWNRLYFDNLPKLLELH